jgi:hypothetical protein
MNHIKMLLAMTLLLVTSSVTARSQTIGPSTLFDALTTAADSSMYDSLYVERPPYILGWNWGGSLRGINEDLHTNIHHMGYPFQFDALADQRSFHPIRSFPDQNAMIMAPSWSISRDTFWDPTSQITIDNSYYPWYADAAHRNFTTVDQHIPLAPDYPNVVSATR